MSVLDLARPNILALKPYSSARMESAAAAVGLDANESPWPPAGDTLGLNRYPEPQPTALRNRLAALYGVAAEQVLIGRGSDEGIDLLVRAFCRPGIDAVAINPPTFNMYAVCAGVQGAQVQAVPLAEGFRLDVGATLDGLSPAVRLLFVCSPNNPTGGLVPLADIERLSTALANRALVIVDEAYIEFAASASAVTLLPHNPNLGVLRTLSKAWGLAGARIGALLADEEIIDLLRRIMPPYPLPTPSVAAALAALDDAGRRLTGERVGLIGAERERMATALAKLPGISRVYPSQANFLTAAFNDAAGARRALTDEGFAVRDVGKYPGLAGCLRLSIGLPEENTRLLATLDRFAEAA